MCPTGCRRRASWANCITPSPPASSPPTRHFAELGDIIAGKAAGRTGADQLTFADLTGTGVQDTAIATLAFERAVAAGGRTRSSLPEGT